MEDKQRQRRLNSGGVSRKTEAAGLFSASLGMGYGLGLVQPPSRPTAQLQQQTSQPLRPPTSQFSQQQQQPSSQQQKSLVLLSSDSMQNISAENGFVLVPLPFLRVVGIYIESSACESLTILSLKHANNSKLKIIQIEFTDVNEHYCRALLPIVTWLQWWCFSQSPSPMLPFHSRAMTILW